MIRMFLLPLLMLTGCGAGSDRLTDEQASAEQNAAIEAPIDIAVPPPAAPPAKAAKAEYRAVGTEPGWAFTVTPTTIRYEGDYGSVIIAEPTPPRFRPVPGRYSGTRLQLTIAPGPCNDGMSDKVYRHTVQLVADGKTVSGCGGGTVAPAELAGTSWTVTAINGRPTPGGAQYFIQFTASDLSARFGCNNIGGGYRLNGDHLSTGDLAQNLMGCPEPAATFERLGSAVLRSNMRIERSGGETMRLVSEAGSIDLRRAI